MKYIKAIITGVMTMTTVFFSGQVQTTMCCVSCAMKKEDEVEFINYDNDYDLDVHD